MQAKNTSLEDFCSEIGFERCVRLSAAFGGRNIYIPDTMRPAHPLARLLGEPAAARLATHWGGATVYVPRLTSFERWRMVHAAAALAQRGLPARDIARALMVTPRHVSNLLGEAALIGEVAAAHAATVCPPAAEQATLDLPPGAAGVAPPTATQEPRRASRRRVA